MNVRHLVPSVSRWLLSTGSLMLAVHASGADLSKFKRIEPQFIAALGVPAATSGNDAQSWGFWNQDPGPCACKLDHYPQLRRPAWRRHSGNSTLQTGGWKNTA